MKKLIILSLLLLSCGGSGGSVENVEASPNNAENKVRINMLHIEAPTALSFQTAQDVIHEVAGYLTANTELEFIVSSVRTIPDPLPEIDDWNRQAGIERMRSGHLWVWLANNKMTHTSKNRELMIIIDKGLDNNGVVWNGGVASNACGLYNPASYAFAFLYPIESDRELEFKAATYIVAHEIGHLAGAKHTKEQSLMYPLVTPEIARFWPNVNITPENNEQIRRCNSRRTRIIFRRCRSSNNPFRCKRIYKIRGVRRRDLWPNRF